MINIEKIFSNPTLLLKRIGYFALTIFIAVYAYFQIMPRQGANFETETALAVSIDKTQESTGYIFRSEQLIPMSNATAVTGIAKNGQRVSVGDYVANAYNKSLDLEMGAKVDEIERQLDILEKSNIGASFAISDISKIDAKSKEILNNIYIKISNNNLLDTIGKKDSLLVYFNKRAIASHSVENYNRNIDQKKSEKEALQRNLSGNSMKIISPSAGYYSNEVDGFEGLFDPNILENLTLNQFDEIVSESPNGSLILNSAGKIVTDYTWYIASKISKIEAGDYEVDQLYTIRFPLSMEKEISMILEKKVSETDKDECILIFKTNLMPENFNYAREQKIEIINNHYTGLKIQKKALRIDKETGKKGVFVLVGDIIEFRLVEEIYEFDNYYLISMDDAAYAFEEDDNIDKQTKSYSKLKLYDHVILYGKELYDGKIIGK